MSINILNEDALLFYTTLLAGIFQKSESGKGLSEANFTASEKAKLENAALITQLFSGDYSDLNGKPTDLSQFVNSPGFQTAAQVTAAIASAIGTIGSISLAPVDELPDVQDAAPNTIYLLARADTEENNLRDEYILFGGAWEKIGSTAVDMSGYVRFSDVMPLSNSRIAELVTLAMEDVS